MAGHSKWSKVKRLKGALDSKRGMLFSKLSKEITIAARMGGGNPALNHRLRAAVQSARSQSMPNDNIERAIKKGTGELGATAVEEMIYEGYAPGGVAVIVEAATDNKNRTAADMRQIFSKNHGSLGGPGSVSYLFHRRGLITVPVALAAEDRVLEIILDAGAEEMESDDSHHSITTPPDKLYAVSEALRGAGIEPDSQKLTFIPETTVAVTQVAIASQVLRLCDSLEENDDVLNVHSNFEISDDVLASVQGSNL
jgi:YebC/PmpR family DNA-binding regulatory protein